MSKAVKAVCAVLLPLALAIPSGRAALGQAQPPKPLALQAGQGVGAPADIPGINKIDVVLTLTFDGPVRREDVEDIALNGNGVAAPPAILKSASWTSPQERSLRLAFPLENLLKAGVKFLAGTNVIPLECDLLMRGGFSYVARARFNLDEPDGVKVPFQAAERPLPLKPSPQPAIPPQPPAPTPEASSAGPIVAGETIAEGTIGAAGGRLEAPGEVAIGIPAGALASAEKIRIRRAPNGPPQSRLYAVERESGQSIFAKPVTVELAVAPGNSAGRPVPVQQIQGPLWKSVPGRFDSEAGKLVCRVRHFSFLGWITEAHVKTAAGALMGAAVGIYLVTPAGVLSLTGLAVVSVSAYIGSQIANPIVDQVNKLGLDRCANFGDRFRIFWTENPNRPGFVSDEACYLVYFDAGSGQVLAMEDASLFDEKTSLDYATGIAEDTARPFDKVQRIKIPKAIIQLATELVWAQVFYSQAKFTLKKDDTEAALPAPMEVLIIDATNKEFAGKWDGTKLTLDKDSVQSFAKDSAAFQIGFHLKRQPVVAHEYWHVIYSAAGYDAPYDWFNECMAVAFESEVFPERNRFISDYPPAQVAAALATGFAQTGRAPTVKYNDNSMLRGYLLWPWGKFLLHRGYDQTRTFGHNGLAEAKISELFGEFAMALLCKDQEIADKPPVVSPQERIGDFKFILSVPLGLAEKGAGKSVSTTTGWSSLVLGKMMSSEDVKLGDAVRYASAPDGILSRPRSLSFVLVQANVEPSKAAEELARAGTPPPLIVRRQTPADEEWIVGLHPANKEADTERRRLQDLVKGGGKVAVPGPWLGYSAPVSFPLAFVGMATKAPSSGGNNPVWTYILLPPDKIRVQPSGAEVGFAWETPKFGPGLKAEDVYKGYRVFTQKGKDAPIAVMDVLLPAAEEKASVPAQKIGSFDRIGLAAEDKVMTDAEGRPLLSPVAWTALQNGQIMVSVTKPNPDKKGPFDDEPLAVPLAGAEVVCDYTDKGRPVHLTATTPAKGGIRFEVPLDTPVTLKWEKETQTVTCTAKALTQSVVFSTLKLKTVSTPPIIR